MRDPAGLKIQEGGPDQELSVFINPSLKLYF